MDVKTKKIGGAVLIGLSCIAMFALLFIWMDLAHGVGSADKVKQIVPDGENFSAIIKAVNYIESASIAMLILISVAVFAVITGFFSKNKLVRGIILSIESVTIIISIVLCCEANKSIYSISDPEVIYENAFLSISAFQMVLLQIVVIMAILLTATSIWYISGFVKEYSARKQSRQSIENGENISEIYASSTALSNGEELL